MKKRHIAYILALGVLAYSVGDCVYRKSRESHGLVDAKVEQRIDYPVATVPETHSLVSEIHMFGKDPSTYQSWPDGTPRK